MPDQERWFTKICNSKRSDENGDIAILVEIDGNPMVIAECFRMVGPDIIRDNKKLANLFMASRDLLEACEAMIFSFHDHPDRDESSLGMAKVAIAKAKGEIQ